MAPKQKLKDFMAKENEKKAKRLKELSTRHSRFGTNIVVKDKATQQARIVHSVNAANMLEVQNVGRKTAPNRKMKDQEPHIGMLIHKKKFGETNIPGSDEEEQVKQDLKKMAIDMLENSYNQLINVLLDSFYSDNVDEDDCNEHEKYKFIKISAFFMSILRLNAYEELKAAKAKHKSSLVLSGTPAPVLTLPVGMVSSSLKLQNIDFIFSKGYYQLIRNPKSSRNMNMYLACVEYFLELLYLIQDMEKSAQEKTRKNAQTLKQKIFTLQICELAKFGLKEYEFPAQSRYFLATVFRFTAVLYDTLEVYAKGRVLYVQTHRMRKAKKSLENEEEEDPVYYDNDNLFIEKKFNFKASVIELVEYGVIDNFLRLLETPAALDDELISAIGSFFNRVVTIAKGTWMFYQLRYMNTFNKFLSEYRKELRYQPIVKAIQSILNSFFEKCKENPLLALEIIFPFTSLEMKNAILCNYEDIAEAGEDNEYYPKAQDSESEKELEIEEFERNLEANKWTDNDDLLLIEYYGLFQDDLNK